MSIKESISSEVAKAAPPVGVSIAAGVGGLTLNEVVAIATLAYIVMQAAYLGWKWYRESKSKP